MSTKKALKSKAPKEPKAPKEFKNLPWTDSMVISLLKIVQITGAHVASGKKSTAAWCEVNRTFFAQEENLPFKKEKHYKCDTQGKDDFRKLRDKFNSTMADVTDDINTGNQSGKEGDLSPLYQLVMQITNEIDDADEKATAAKEKKEADAKLLNTNETTVLAAQNGTKKRANESTSVRVKHVDGTISVNSERGNSSGLLKRK